MQTSESNLLNRARRNLDWLLGAALFVSTFLVYLDTLAPSVAYLFDDSLEFQLLASRMAIAHPTGYPFYSLLIKLATFLPVGDVAYRVNLVSAFSAAGTVMFVYLAGRILTQRFLSANTRVGQVLVRAPAFLAASILAYGETFWSQAVIAEVYASQAFLTAVILWLAFRWSALIARQSALTSIEQKPLRSSFDRSLVAIAFLAGLMLTHHRISVLLIPPLAVYLLSYDRSILRQPKLLVLLLAAFLLPLLLYLYLPIRGMATSSLDGAYENTPQGFFNWVLGTAYTVFVTQDPLNRTRDAVYYAGLVVTDLSAFGLLAALGGFFVLFWRAWQEWLLFALALAANLVFLSTYRVPDIDVFFIPTFVLLSLLLTAGLAGLLWLAFYVLSTRAALLASVIGAVLVLFVPYSLFRENYTRVDLSNKTDVIAYGRDVLNQPLDDKTTIIGILGEMTLLRYLQETQSLRPDVETIAADREQDRSSAIQDALKRGRTVLITRPLSDLAQAHSLSSLGPLVEVQNKANRGKPPTPAQRVDADFGGVKLLGYDVQKDAGPPRVTLYWHTSGELGPRLVSLKLIDANGKLAGQMDRQPVLDTYPTSAWRIGEYVADTYEIPIFVGAAPGEYALQVTMYDPDTGEVFGQRELEQVTISAQTSTVPSELLDVGKVVVRDLGGIELSGYDLDTSETYLGGSQLPLTLLWRVLQDAATREIDITVRDEFGKTVAQQLASVGGAGAAAGQYMRQHLEVELPATLAAGKYEIQVAVRGGWTIPFQSNSFTLGIVEVQAP